jgi:AcrR family transcriptional regulator
VKERRSHAERRAETRRRILDAAIQSIGSVGLARTTAAEIERRSGVTWGAVQHHFGDKDGILVAVLEDSFARFAERLEGVSDDASLEKRVDEFVERAWAHFGSPLYRASFEILLHFAGPDGSSAGHSWQGEQFAPWTRIWSRLFDDGRSSRRRSLGLQRYAIAVFSGLASLDMLEGPTTRVRAPELRLLKSALLRELSTPSVDA